MSHFTIIQTQIVESDALVQALQDLGFGQVEVHAIAQQLYGYRGDLRQQTAEVIIRRKFIGRLSNDIGFKRQDNGTFDAIISGFDRKKYSQKWLNNLSQRYAYHAAKAKLEDRGFNLISEEVGQQEEIRLVLRRMV